MYPVDSEWKALYGYKESQMYGVWTNLSVNQPIGERELEQNSFRQRITYIMGEMGAEAIKWIRK